ncbi:hypothetical protein BFP72_11800 [Reichenbachiella sp. 5M10]|nr:hypothetical protein BFP72_11800 [Reichenbachiella sp. 5M10]
MVTDAQTNEPLPYANIIYGSEGTSTNMDGSFVLTIDPLLEEQKLHIRYIGYESRHITLDEMDTNLYIELVSTSVVLDDIMVYSAEQIMSDLDGHRQINYEYGDQLLLSYYKETVTSNDDIYYLAEGIFDIYLPTIYSGDKTAVSARKTRKREFIALDTIEIPMITGHVSDMVNGATRRKGSFLDPNQRKNYIFSKEDLTIYDGREVFKIYYEPKTKKGTSKGVLYIDSESKAVIKAEYYPVIDQQNFWTNVKWTEEYTQVDGTWFIHRVSYTGEWKSKERSFAFNALMVVTDFEDAEGKPKLKNELSNNAIFFHEASTFSDSFWGIDNYVQLSEHERMSFAKK